MPDTWMALLLPGGETTLELLGGELLDLGAEGFTPEGDRLRVFFRREVLTDDLLETIHSLYGSFAKNGLLPDGGIEKAEVENEDWVGRWRRSLGPIRAGKHFVVIPPGVEAAVGADEIALRLEPRMAFGTGEHPTTRMALALLEETVHEGDRIIDMGCGNGILSIAALLLGAGSALGIDNEQEAIEETLENASAHGVGGHLEATFGDVLNLHHSGTYDLLLANIFVNPILQGLPDWLSLMTPDARFIFTGVQAGEEEARLRRGVAALGLELVEAQTLDGWFAARCRRLPA